MDYADDLDRNGFDPTDVRIACRNWRSSDSKKMPTPGELLAYCKRVFRADHHPNFGRVEALPRRAPAELLPKAEAVPMLQALIAEMAEAKRMRGPLDRKPGETAAQQAERLWPNHRIDRMRART